MRMAEAAGVPAAEPLGNAGRYASGILWAGIGC